MRHLRWVALFLCAAACYSPAKVAPEPSGLPPLPTSIQTPSGPVAVVFVDSIPSPEPGFTVLGRFSPLDREIFIWKRVSGRAEQYRILGHESCHVWLWDRGERQRTPDTESFCDAWAYFWIHQLLAAR